MRKTYVTIFVLAMLSISAFFLASCKHHKAYFELGAPKSKITWIYLCGLLKEVVSPNELPEWRTIDRIGKELGITFLAIVPKHRSTKLNNMLCWPSDSREELARTYQEIMHAVGERVIDGYIGFSNGGFFLNRFAQQEELRKSIISIGAAGPLNVMRGPHNNIDLMISKDDVWHYEHAIAFYNDAKNSNMYVTLHEYEGGHIVPYDDLKAVLLNAAS